MRKWFCLVLLCALLVPTAGIRAGDLDKPLGADSARSINIDLGNIRADTTYASEIGFFGLLFTSTEDTKIGFGGAVLYDYLRFAPLVLRGGVQVGRSQINTDEMLGADFVTLGFDVDVLFHPVDRGFRPYAGLGLTLYYNFWPTDRGPRGWIGPYDEYTPSAYDYGTGLAPHVRAGGKYGLSRTVSLALDFKYTYARPSAEITLRYDLTGDEQLQTVRYDQRVATLMIGVAIRLD
jgi:hypothetical protein